MKRVLIDIIWKWIYFNIPNPLFYNRYLFDHIYWPYHEWSEKQKEKRESREVWIDPAGGTHVGYDDPAAKYE